MASLLVSEHDYDFIDNPPEDFYCPVTFDLLLEPHQTLCCGNHFSQAAVTRLEGKPCPLCKKTLNTMPDKFFQRTVKQLKACCANKSLGCEWVGELGSLDLHQSQNSVEGECQFVTVACPYSCGDGFQRCQLEGHKANDCPNRQFTCQYCGHRATYFKVTSEHWPVCERYPVECPNKSLGCQWTGERGTLDQHLSSESEEKCQFTTVACPYDCGSGFQRYQLEGHKVNDCPNRQFTCQYCGHKATYNKVTNEHWSVCERYPVECPNKSLGCQWTGERGTLDQHLSSESEEKCQFTTVACPYDCGSGFQRYQLEGHKVNDCPNRQFTCQYCGHKATYNKVTNEHWSVCERYHIECPNKSLGCQWAGERGDLNQHLKNDSEEGECQFVTVACRYNCGGNFQRCQLEGHKINNCPNRLFACQYCDYEDTFIKITSEHQSICKQYLFPCPNQCGENAIERQHLPKHLEEACPLQVIKCEFSYAGCEVECQRQHMQPHLDENVRVHLSKVSHKSVQQQKQIETLQSHIQALQCKTEQQQSQIDTLITALNQFVQPKFGPPYDLVMTDFEEHKQADDDWYSPPFYSHVGGYKMCLNVNANGSNDTHTHVSVFVYLMQGEHDDRLKWPFRGEITIQLLNQRRDGGHLQWIVNCKHQRATGNWGRHQFIAQIKLNTEDKNYLKRDCLKFRIAKVVVKSI